MTWGVANAFGLYGMGGNVSEWCLDNYTWDPRANMAPRGVILSVMRLKIAYRDPIYLDPATDNRCIRGGSYQRPGEDMSISRRGYARQREIGSSIGFRVILSGATPPVSN